MMLLSAEDLLSKFLLLQLSQKFIETSVPQRSLDSVQTPHYTNAPVQTPHTTTLRKMNSPAKAHILLLDH